MIEEMGEAIIYGNTLPTYFKLIMKIERSKKLIIIRHKTSLS